DLRWLPVADSMAQLAESLDDARADGHRIRASVLALEKQNDAAVRAFARAMTIRPFDDDLTLRFARAWAHAGKPDREKDVYLATIRQRPHDWRPYWWLATWERRAGNVDECIRRYEQMVEKA